MTRFIVCLIVTLISWPFIFVLNVIFWLVVLSLMVMAHSGPDFSTSGPNKLFVWPNDVYFWTKNKYNDLTGRFKAFIEQETGD